MPDKTTTPTRRILPGSDEHSHLITGSKIAAILGISPFKPQAVLWHQMRGLGPADEPTDAMRRGTIQEDSILAWFFQVLRPDITQTSGEVTITHPDIEWAAANPDATGIEDGRTIFVEAKSIARAKTSDEYNEPAADEWGEPGTDEIPTYYYVQVMWQMHLSHHDRGDNVTRTYVVKHGPWVDQYDVYPINYDPTIGHELQRRAEWFHDTLTLDTCPVEISNIVGVHTFFSKLHPDIEPTSDWEISEELAVDYLTAKAQKKEAQAHEDGAKARILKAMGTARTASCHGHTLAYRRPTKTGVSLYPSQNLPTIDQITNQN